MGRFWSHSVCAPTPRLTSSQKRRTSQSKIVRSMRRQRGNGKKEPEKIWSAAPRPGQTVCCSPSHSDRKESKNNFIIFTCRRRFKRALALGHPSERSFGGATENSMLWRSVCDVCGLPTIRGRWDSGPLSQPEAIARVYALTVVVVDINRSRSSIEYFMQFHFFPSLWRELGIHEWSEPEPSARALIHQFASLFIFPFVKVCKMWNANSENKQLKFNVNDLHCDHSANQKCCSKNVHVNASFMHQ